VDLVQLVRVLVVELTHTGLNFRFDMRIVFTVNYFLVGGDVPVDSETLLMIDFVNLKIKLTQSFGCAHKDRVCVHIFREVSAHICTRINVYIISLTKKILPVL
jgi:hypothetical protein